MTERLDLTRFAPVGEKADPPSKPSQSLLAKLDTCPRSAYLYLRYGGGVQSHAMSRGSAFHEFAEKATKALLDTGEIQMPVDVAVNLIEEVMDSHEYTFPLADRKSLRVMATNWAKAFALPRGLVAVESMVEVKLGKWTIRGKIDLAWAEEGVVYIRDYKSSLNIPSQEQFDRSFQQPFYALLLAEGVYEEGVPDGYKAGQRVMPALPVRTNVAELYPRYYDDEHDALVGRYATLETDDLVEFKADVISLLDKLDHGLETGEYPAVPGTHCGFCPAPHECPIPQEFRPFDEITSVEQASKTLEAVVRRDAESKRLRGSVRAFAADQELEAVPCGTDEEYAFKYVESKSLKKSAKATLEKSDEALFTVSKSTRFERRKKKNG